MKLDELLDGDERVVSEWMRKKDLLHHCDCGYLVYDEEEVSSAVQRRWGDRRCDEIFEWACDLSNQFGWMSVESAIPEKGIYHCQHCAESELSLLLDMEALASRRGNEKVPQSTPTGEGLPVERLVIYLDESYSEQFPRKEGGSFAYGAVILPESQIPAIEGAVAQILKEVYRSTPPKELKYNKIDKSPRLLKQVGERVVRLLRETPGLNIVGLFVPRSGFFGERRRSIQAVADYARKSPLAEDLAAVDSAAAIEAAVRSAANDIAQALVGCLASHIGGRNASARLIFDPRSKELDEPLIAALKTFLPKVPIDSLCIRHGDAIVTNWPTQGYESLGNRVAVELKQSSHDCRGLQLADFLAGDIRAFFGEAHELLDVAQYSHPLTNRRVLFPEIFRAGKITVQCRAKLEQQSGKSFLPLYREQLVNGLISYYTRNGQMRNLNTLTGDIFDLMD